MYLASLLIPKAPNGFGYGPTAAAHNMAPIGGVEFDNLDGKKHYSDWKAYGQSKFCNLLFAKELAKRFAETAKKLWEVSEQIISKL
jgi:NAD(P)-dependent dehydrogenase (short-subunit alcohol dehydrogenase family)